MRIAAPVPSRRGVVAAPVTVTVSLVVALVLAAVAAVTSAAPAAAAPPGISAPVPPTGSSPYPIEDPAGYDGQRHCASAAGPGTTYLLAWTVRRYGGRPGGTLRGCDVGGASEHKDGRAYDWSLDRRDPADAARAQRFLTELRATDAAGDAAALGRRAGVMYVIWDDRIYSARSGFAPEPYLHAACVRLKGCSRTLRHRDHVHVSLSRAGAAAQTSFYRSRGVTPVPVLRPGTRVLDADATQVWSTTVVPGRPARTPFRLERGRTYRLVGEGRHRFGPGQRVADAACVWAPGRRTWVPQSQGLLVDGHSPWVSTCASAGAGRPVHQVLWTAPRSGPVTLSVGRGQGGGGLRFHLLSAALPTHAVTAAVEATAPSPRPARRHGAAAKRLRAEELRVPARARHGVRTRRSLRPTARYRVVVEGVASQAGVDYDGACVRVGRRWRPQHSLDLARPDADHFSLHVQGVRLELRSLSGPRSCSRRHLYAATIRPHVRGRARVTVWHPRHDRASARGALTVRIEELPRSRPAAVR